MINCFMFINIVKGLRRHAADIVSWTLDIGKFGYVFFFANSSYL